MLVGAVALGLVGQRGVVAIRRASWRLGAVPRPPG